MKRDARQKCSLFLASENHNFFTMSCHCQTTKFSTDPTKIVLLFKKQKYFKNKSFQKKTS